MTHGCGACVGIVIILLVLLCIVGVILIFLHPEIGIKLREIWAILGDMWSMIR